MTTLPTPPNVAPHHSLTGSSAHHVHGLTHHLETIEAHVTDLSPMNGVSRDRERMGHCGAARNEYDSNLRAFIAGCGDVAAIHALSSSVSECTPSRKATEFLGLIIHTGCLVASTGGLKHYQTYMAFTGTMCTLNTRNHTQSTFGTVKALSIGMTTIIFHLTTNDFNSECT